ncbi:isoprenylcysteine carboxyl methyltransferase family protein [Bacillus massiliglaciei]|uniref:isoprenylcysteine carboxyl methyltransferase family protein n=1 Tax=Bacillus massiliglaciei TaxID=1816693 RepID=UPI000A5A3387|nr:isoprenylcysteine carboxylmethyltransferase family protein [Bacillus massiliglaciei]
MIFAVFIVFLCIQRLTELVIAKNNEKALKAEGAIEYGKSHYPWMVSMHAAFFISLILEVYLKGFELSKLWPFWLTIFLFAQAGRFWVIKTLGKYWNTKIIVLSDAKVVAAGPYKYIKHPNYAIVATEILVISLLFNAFFTAVVFSLLNLWMMSVRIPLEEKALKSHTGYGEVFRGK